MSSINESNIINVDDSAIIANTPMVVIENNGKPIAVPIMSGGADVSGVTATPDDVLNTVKFVDSSGNLVDGAIAEITPVVIGNNVVIPKGFNAQARTLEVGQGSSSSNVAIYRCTEYDSGEAIPAYSNITVSGITSDSAANGAMILLDRTATGGNRLWGNDSYRLGYDSFNEHWCFYDSSNVYMPWADSAMFKAKCIYTTNEGTNANKINWHDATVDGDGFQTEVFDTRRIQSESGNYGFYYWFMLKLKAGVEYTLGMPKDCGTLGGKDCFVYNTKGDQLVRCNLDKTANGVEFNYGNTYTPTVDEVVYIKVGNASSSGYNGTFYLYCYPAPEVIDYVNKEPWQCTWQAVTGTGNIAMTAQAVAERSATGIKVWSGYTGTQDASTKEWSFGNAVKSNMLVKGITPRVGNIYAEDTSLHVANIYTKPPENGKMVALFHYDNKQSVFVDSTETCMMTTDSQWYIVEDHAKFGRGSWFYNYMNFHTGMGGKIIGLPELDAFTIEFWHWYDAYYDKFGGPLIISENDEDNHGDYGATWLSGVNFQEGSPFYSKKRWFHHALVREAGSQMVTEYIDGKPAAMYQFAPKLGGGRGVWVCAGGVEMGQSGNIGNRMDELAIFNYARYHGEFTPPTEPYANVISGLGRQKGEPREVEVTGIESIIFANDPGYNLIDQTATGTSRRWVTADGQWYIYFDWDMEGTWVIANKTAAYDDGWVCAARLRYYDDADPGAEDFDPIGHSGWVDYYTDKPITVRRLREPIEDDPSITRITLTGAGLQEVDGKYFYDSNPNALIIYKSDFVTTTCAAFFGGEYCIHQCPDEKSYNFGMYYLARVRSPLSILYKIERSKFAQSGASWTVVTGDSPAPRNA